MAPSLSVLACVLATAIAVQPARWYPTDRINDWTAKEAHLDQIKNGRHATNVMDGKGILKAAYDIYIPAFKALADTSKGFNEESSDSYMRIEKEAKEVVKQMNEAGRYDRHKLIAQVAEHERALNMMDDRANQIVHSLGSLTESYISEFAMLGFKDRLTFMWDSYWYKNDDMMHTGVARFHNATMKLQEASHPHTSIKKKAVIVQETIDELNSIQNLILKVGVKKLTCSDWFRWTTEFLLEQTENSEYPQYSKDDFRKALTTIDKSVDHLEAQLMKSLNGFAKKSGASLTRVLNAYTASYSNTTLPDKKQWSYPIQDDQ